MNSLQKFCSGEKALVGIAFCIISAIAVSAHFASALTLAEIINQPKVLGDTTSALYPYPSGSLVNDHGTIYFISGGTKVPFANYKAFTGLGYSLRNAVSGNLSGYSLSQTYVINTANAAHPWGSWVSYKGVIYYSAQSGMIGVPSAEVFLSNGGQWSMVVKANNYDISLIKSSSSLAVLTDNDPRIIGLPNLQFGGTAASPQNNSSGSSSNPVQAPVQAPSSVSATTSPTSFIPQVIVPVNVYASSSATFLASSADPNTPLVYTFNWDDGSIANSLSTNAAVHTYTIPGVYMLNVSIEDSQTNSFSTTAPVTVLLPVSQTPTVPQLSIPTGTIVGAQATVSASASDPQSSPLTYTFNWGDGTASTIAPTNSATHVYSTSDSYVVTVTVTNGLGFSSLNTGYLYVAP
jgi:hypothetical protein